MTARTRSASTLLRAWGQGDTEARDALLPLVYREPRAQAARYLNKERRDHTLQPTALVHEAYLRLVGQQRVFVAEPRAFFRPRRTDDASHSRGPRPEAPGRKAAHRSAEGRVGRARRSVGTVEGLRAPAAGCTSAAFPNGKWSMSLARTTVSREWKSARAWLFRRMTRGRTEGRCD